MHSQHISIYRFSLTGSDKKQYARAVVDIKGPLYFSCCIMKSILKSSPSCPVFSTSSSRPGRSSTRERWCRRCQGWESAGRSHRGRECREWGTRARSTSQCRQVDLHVMMAVIAPNHETAKSSVLNHNTRGSRIALIYYSTCDNKCSLYRIPQVH